MRELRTDGLKSLGNQGAGPWRLDEDRLLRTSWRREPIRSERQARELFDIYRTAHDAGAPTPEPLEIVRTQDGYGVVVDYVKGMDIGVHMLLGSFAVEEAGRDIAALARGLHALEFNIDRDWNARFLAWAQALGAILPEKEASFLVGLVESVPASRTLLHGDLHPGNVLVHDGRPTLIDMGEAGFGHPVLDLAILRSRLFFGVLHTAGGPDAPKRVAASQALWRAALGGYFEGASEADLEGLDACLAILAELEFSCRIFALAQVDAKELSPQQRKRVESLTESLDALMPRLGGLTPGECFDRALRGRA